MKIPVVQKVLEANERIAEENRGLFEKMNVLVINLVSGLEGSIPNWRY